MGLGDPPRSPFATASWEPRFVIEHSRVEGLRAAIELWRLSEAAWREWPPIRHVARHPTYLLVCCPLRKPHQWEDPWEELAEPLALADLPGWIMQWLSSATYPERPWFDGGERRGYTVFWAHYECEELERNSYAQLVVMPKWFETHK